MPRDVLRYDEDDDDDDGPEDFNEDDTILCPYCGAAVYDDAERCPRCERYFSREELGSGRPRWIVVTAILCVLLVLAGVLSATTIFFWP